MTNEQDTTLGALKTAIKMEIDGKEFYIKASQASKNELGKKLLTKLAGEEDIHRQVFERIYNEISTKQGWPVKAFKADGGSSLRTVFAKALESMDKKVNSLTSELDAIQTAMTMENKTFDFYKERAGKARYPAEKQFFEELSVQEEEHYRILLDYFEFLKDPSAWFVKSEHHSMDG